MVDEVRGQLLSALRNHNNKKVRILLALGANPNDQLFSGDEVITQAMPYLIRACREENFDIAEALLTHKADVNCQIKRTSSHDNSWRPAEFPLGVMIKRIKANKSKNPHDFANQLLIAELLVQSGANQAQKNSALKRLCMPNAYATKEQQVALTKCCGH